MVQEKIDKKRNGGIQARLGVRAHAELEKIKDKKLSNETSKERLSTEKITNLIVRHKSWEEISKSIIEAPSEEVELYGI